MSSHNEPSPETLADAFQDFDLEDVFRRAEEHVGNQDSKNFVVEFGLEKARIALDLSFGKVSELLNQDPDHQREYPIRWMYVMLQLTLIRYRLQTNCMRSNIWDPSSQWDIMNAIGNEYGFSPRLLGLMTTPKSQQDEARRHKERRTRASRHQRTPKDLEKGDVMNGSFSMKTLSAPIEHNDNLALYLQVKDTVNYFSTDQTQKGALFQHSNIVPLILTLSKSLHRRIKLAP